MQETPEVIASRSIQRTYRKEIWRKFLLSVRRYNLIEENDHIAVCISGGKDSLALAVCMRELQKYGRVPFRVSYLAMDPGYTGENREKMIENTRKLGLDIHVFDSPIFEAVETAPKSPCHVCAAMRRGYLYKEARKLGCNKIALGHHLDDAVETILMSQLYGGEYKTMMPLLNSKNYEGMQLIRPLYLVREKDIINWTRYLGIDTLRCACRVTRSEDGGKRKEVKEILHMLEKKNNAVVWNMLHAIEKVNLETVLGFCYTTHGPVETLMGKAVDENEARITD